MNIIETTGNLLNFPENINVICHQANTENVMGAGIALQIKNQIPEMWKVDCEFNIPKGEKRLGNFSVAVFERNGVFRHGVNLYGQQLKINSSDGFPTDYNAVRMALDGLKNSLLIGFFRNPVDIVIGFPKFMGCALGGGDWNTYRGIIEETFKYTEFTIVFVEFKP